MKNKKHIEKLISQFDWMFGIKYYDRGIVYKKEDKDGIAAEISYDEPYQRVTIYIYPSFFNETLRDQKKALLHEFCHLITLPSKALTYKIIDGGHVSFDEAKNENERATSKIENLIDALLNNRLKNVKDAYKKYGEIKKRKVSKSKKGKSKKSTK